MRQTLAVVLLLALCFSGAVVRAEERSRIVALVPPTDTVTLTRLKAELAAAGFDLRAVQPSRWAPTRDDIRDIARRENAIAGMALLPREGTVEIWIVDRVTGKTVLREVAAGVAGQGVEETAELVAICAVETLRATLMETALPYPSRGEIAAPTAVRDLLRSRPSRFAARVSGAVGYGFGSLGLEGAVGVSAIATLSPHLRVGLDGLLPVTTPTVAGPEGRAEVRRSLAGAFFEAALIGPGARFGCTLGGGAWLGVLSVRGAADPPYVGRSDRVMTLVPHIDAGGTVRISDRIAVGLRFSGAIAAPEAVVRFAGRDVANWGRPFVLATLGLEVGLD